MVATSQHQAWPWGYLLAETGHELLSSELPVLALCPHRSPAWTADDKSLSYRLQQTAPNEIGKPGPGLTSQGCGVGWGMGL